MANRNRRLGTLASTSRSPTMPPNPFSAALELSPVPDSRTRESVLISPMRSYSVPYSHSPISPYDMYAYDVHAHDYLTRSPLVSASASPRSPMASSTANFIALHTTQTVSHTDTDECPICLDAYTTEPCLRIMDITGCNHHIGATCLQEMLENRPHVEKKCPLCRTVWIPSPTPAIPPRGQSLGASRMAEMYLGLDGIGADIASTQGQVRDIIDLHDQTVAGYAGRGSMSPSEEIQRAARRPRHGTERTQQPIVVDSSSEGEEDYATQVQNFENLTRDIANIRQRARNTQYGRRGSKRRDKRRSGGREGHHSGSGSDNNNNNNNNNANTNDTRKAVASTGIRRGAHSDGRPRASTLNRFINTMRLNPWEHAMSETRVRRDGHSPSQAHRRSTGQALQRNSTTATAACETSPWQDPISPPYILCSPPSPAFPPPPHAAPSVAETIAALESSGPRVPDRVSSLNRRENWLRFQEQSLQAQQTELARREVGILTRERIAEEVMEVVRRQRGEIEALVRRQREELEMVVQGGL